MANEAKQPDSQFNARSDRAALALRQSLIGQGRQMPEKASVEVGADGKPPAAPPPAGSYIGMQLEQQRAAQQRQQPAAQRAEDEELDPGAAAPPAPANAPTELSDNANRRITDLINQLRDKDRELQAAIASSQRQGESLQQLEARLNALQQQHDQAMQQNLDNLDPVTREQVLANTRVQESIQQVEQRVLSRVAPVLQRLEEDSIRRELEGIAARYPRFSVETHGPLIQRFRQRNPACTIEQAFRAVAEPEELESAPRQRAAVVPPIVPAGNGRSSSQRFAPASEQPKSDPREELVADAQRLRDLARKGEAKPVDWHEHLKRRLS